jgi:alkanesulfonate monooxygenase SsuD/methylene tetrahydromethanopterin reductase-like flavin-dependent oxidoreductase (luciferase family)
MFEREPPTLSFLGLPIRVAWSLASRTIRTLIEEAERCETGNLDGVWYPDHAPPFSSYNWPELYVTLSAIAGHTKRVFLGSLVTDVQRRHPMVTAHAFASLSHLAPNRVILGMGAGAGPSQRPYGIPMTKLASKLEEGIDIIRALYDAKPAKPADYSGKHFRLRKAGAPMQPASKIPIYVAAYGPKMLSITARLADGWLPESHTPETYRETLARVRGEMKKAHRRPEDLEPCVSLIFYPREPDDKAYGSLLKAAKNYLAEYPDILWTAGAGKEHPGLRTHQIIHDRELLKRLSDSVPDKLADATLIYGDRDNCVEKLMKFVEAGCKHIILEPYWIEPEGVMLAIDEASRIKASLLGS